MRKWSFDVDNDKLIKLVLENKKTATSSLYNAEDLPIIGEESIIHFDNGKDACAVKLQNYIVLKFNEMTEDLARLEGEGDCSLKYWKEAHFAFFKLQNPCFTEDDKIVVELFEVAKDLVSERLELGKSIVLKNIDLFKTLQIIEEINAGFNNTLFSVNNQFIIKVCTNNEKEHEFANEYKFYLLNHDNDCIPKLFKYDDSKQDCEYVYEILEKVQGNTLYYYWYKMNEDEREIAIEKIIKMLKKIHTSKGESYNWADKIKGEVQNNIQECKELFDSDDYEMIMSSFDKYDKYLMDNRFAVIHNDLHFDNIIYNDGEMKLIDFNDWMIAPIDFEFRQLYMCIERPWKWANSEMDPLQKPIDYQNIWNYIKKYYEELKLINHLEKRMIIYRIWDDARLLKEYKNNELIEGIVNNSKKL